MEKKKKDLLVFGYGLGLIALVFAVGGIVKHGIHAASMVLLSCSVVLTVVTNLNWQALKPAYDGWMRVAHFIGAIVTSVVLTAVFFFIFTPVGLLLRFIKKDHLKRTFDPGAATYWEQRSQAAFEQKQYQQQY